MPKLTQMNIPQLRKACREKGICGVSKMNKKTLRMSLAKTMGNLYEFHEHNDILYLILSDYIPEMYWCQIAQVSKTYKRVMREVGFSPWYCMCPKCESMVRRYEYDTQKDILWQPYYDVRSDYIMYLKHQLDVVENTVEYYNKGRECYDIFCSIVRNRWIFDIAPKFKKTVLEKLVEMKNISAIPPDKMKLNNLIGNTFLPILFPGYEC